MSIFTPEPTELPKIKANNPDVDLETTGLSAGIAKAQIETDVNWFSRRWDAENEAASMWEAVDMLGADAVVERAREAGIPEGQIAAFQAVSDRKPNRVPANMLAIVRDMATQAASDDPETWVNTDLSQEGIRAKTDARLQEEYAEAQAILSMLPSRQRFAAEMVGDMLSMTSDFRNAPFLLLGGGTGSLMRIVGREAAANVAAEAVTMPSQFEMAERLGIEDPNVIQQLSIAALAGGVLGGGVEAISRGMTYWKGRNRVKGPPEADELVGEIEDALIEGRPMRDVEKMIEDRAVLLLENPEPRFTAGGVAGGTDNVRFPDNVQTSNLDLSTSLRNNAEYQAAKAENPALFEKWEGIQKKQANLRRWSEDLQAPKEQPVPEGVPAEIAEAAPTPARPAEALQEAIETAPARVETRDQRMVREQLQELEREAQELAPQVAFAYRNSTPEPVTPPKRPPQDFQSYLAGSVQSRGQRQAAPKAKGAVVGFKTAKGSTYILHDDGTTQRNKAARSDPGHEGDSGEKKRTQRTIYVEHNAAALSAAGMQGLDGKGARVVIKDNKASLVWWNNDAGGWGTSDSSRDIPFFNDPALGRYPLELWKKKGDVPGYEAYSGMHAGNPIVEIERKPSAELIVADGTSKSVIAPDAAPARPMKEAFDDPTTPEASELQGHKIEDVRTRIETDGPQTVSIETDDGRVLRTDEDVLNFIQEGEAASARLDLCGMGNPA